MKVDFADRIRKHLDKCERHLRYVREELPQRENYAVWDALSARGQLSRAFELLYVVSMQRDFPAYGENPEPFQTLFERCKEDREILQDLVERMTGLAATHARPWKI